VHFSLWANIWGIWSPHKYQILQHTIITLTQTSPKQQKIKLSSLIGINRKEGRNSNTLVTYKESLFLSKFQYSKILDSLTLCILFVSCYRILSWTHGHTDIYAETSWWCHSQIHHSDILIVISFIEGYRITTIWVVYSILRNYFFFFFFFRGNNNNVTIRARKDGRCKLLLLLSVCSTSSAWLLYEYERLADMIVHTSTTAP
jgi:hypothetical protein